MTNKTERRFIREIQIFERAAGDAEGAPGRRDIGGYAAVFNSPTVICGCFREIVAPGAFKRAVVESDVRALFNHDANFVIGRSASKTLNLSEDDKGLLWRAQPPATQWADDLAVSIDRGDISGCSFSFSPVVEEWDYEGDLPTRTLIECDLWDVSAVTWPAYDDTSVALRTRDDARAKAELALRSGKVGEALASRIERKRAFLDRIKVPA